MKRKKILQATSYVRLCNAKNWKFSIKKIFFEQPSQQAVVQQVCKHSWSKRYRLCKDCVKGLGANKSEINHEIW